MLLAGNPLVGAIAPVDLAPGQPWSGTIFESLDNLDGEPTVAGFVGADPGSTPRPGLVGDKDFRGGLGGEAAPDGTVALPTAGRGIDAADRNASGFIPPDTEGAVSVEHIVEIINGRFRILDKNGNQLEDRSLDSFWTTRTGITVTNFSFDPRIQFDQAAGRWYAAAVDNAQNNNSFLFAVSAGIDPTGAWSGFKIDSDNGSGERWADFPQMGFDNAGVYLTANMFDIAGGAALPTEVNVLVLPKSGLLANPPSIALRTKIEDVIGTLGFAAAPVVYKDSTEFGASFPPVFVSADDNSINFSALAGTITAPTIAAQSDTAVSNRAGPPLASQPGLNNLDSGGNRIRSQVVFQNGSYWGVNGINVNNQAAIRFFEITSAFALVQDRPIFATNDEDFIYPSLDVNESEHVVIGMTVTGPARFPAAGYLPGTPPATGTDTVFPFFGINRNGADTYQSLDTSGRNRWGDYSATHFDPQDPSYFWTFQEYAKGVSAAGFTPTWGTDITEISPQGVVAGRLPRTLSSAEGYIIPFGPTGTSPDVQDFDAFFNSDFDIDSFFVTADNSLRGTGSVTFEADDLGSLAVDTVLAVYDADTGVLEGLNDDAVGDDSRVTLVIPSTTSRYIVAVANKLYTAGVGSTSGDVRLVVSWAATFAGEAIALDVNGDGSTGIILSPAEDSDFYRATAPANATGAATITLDPDATLDGELFVFNAAGTLLGSGQLTGVNVTETVNLAGLTPGQEIFITIQSNVFNSVGNGTLAVNFVTAVIPPPPASAPDLNAGSDTGVSGSDNVTMDNTPTFNGALDPGSAGFFVRLFAGATEVGSATADGAGNYTVTAAAPIADGVHNFRITKAVNAATPQSGFSPGLSVTIDTAAPIVNGHAFLFETNHTIQFTLNEDVFGVAAGDLTTTNQTTMPPTTLPAADFAVATAGPVANWRYGGNASGLPGVLPDGDYTATLAAGSVTDRAGNALVGDQTRPFFFLNADANRDRRINLQDFNILAINFGQSPRTFSQGDFTYNGLVNLADFNILASRFGTVLAEDGTLVRTGERPPALGENSPFADRRGPGTAAGDGRAIGDGDGSDDDDDDRLPGLL